VCVCVCVCVVVYLAGRPTLVRQAPSVPGFPVDVRVLLLLLLTPRLRLVVAPSVNHRDGVLKINEGLFVVCRQMDGWMDGWIDGVEFRRLPCVTLSFFPSFLLPRPACSCISFTVALLPKSIDAEDVRSSASDSPDNCGHEYSSRVLVGLIAEEATEATRS